MQPGDALEGQRFADHRVKKKTGRCITAARAGTFSICFRTIRPSVAARQMTERKRIRVVSIASPVSHPGEQSSLAANKRSRKCVRTGKRSNLYRLRHRQTAPHPGVCNLRPTHGDMSTNYSAPHVVAPRYLPTTAHHSPSMQSASTSRLDVWRHQTRC